MKKLVSLVSAIVLIMSVMLSACSPAPAPSPAAPSTSAPDYKSRTTAPVSPSGIPSPAPGPRTETWGVPGPAGPAGKDGGAPAVPHPTSPPRQATTGSDSIGLAAGGAKDIGNFRENIRNNYLPLPTDVTYEGLFYDYFFDTGQVEPTEKLFSPSYGYAVTRDPLSHKTEYYLSVGLNSGLKESDFQRKKLNLVIVLDNSGSMSEYFNQYYYDRFGKRIDAYAGEGISRPRKMDSANESVVAILDQLGKDDRFAIVLFNSTASLLKPMSLVGRTSMRSVRNDVLDVIAGGSTNLAAGVDMATAQFRGQYEIDSHEYENRIIVLTDAQPNTGDFTSSGLMGMVSRNANNMIYTTFIGIGVDFNSQLIEQITKIKGANYYSVRSPREFRQRTKEEFDYMVTPMVFNVRLMFESRGWRIEKVFGSPEANEATGELMRINTLFPSKREAGETKGGLVLLKLKKTSSSPDEKIYLKVSYEDRNGRTDGSEAVVWMDKEPPEYFNNSGIRKGILLTRYASLLKNWMIDERQHAHYSSPWRPIIDEDSGILIPSASLVSQWERQSLSLIVSAPYKSIFRDFSRYFEGEMNAIGDDTLNQELKILNSLSGYR